MITCACGVISMEILSNETLLLSPTKLILESTASCNSSSGETFSIEGFWILLTNFFSCQLALGNQAKAYLCGLGELRCLLLSFIEWIYPHNKILEVFCSKGAVLGSAWLCLEDFANWINSIGLGPEKQRRAGPQSCTGGLQALTSRGLFE